MPSRLSPDGRFAYYSDPREWAAALSAYTGQGPYPAMEPTAPAPTPTPDFNWQNPQYNLPGGPTFTAPPSAVRTAAPSAGPTGPSRAATAPAQRPWYMNYSNQDLMETLRRNPSLRSTLPAHIILGFPNEFFLNNPQFQDLLSPERRATFGAGALPTAPSGVQGPPPVATPTRPGGFPARDEEAGWIRYNAGGPPTLVEPGMGEAPLTPRVGQALQGQPLSPLRTLGNLPFFSAQTLANMPPSEREALEVLANRTGNRAEDFFDWSRRLSSQVGGGGAGGAYAGAPRRRRY